MSRARIGVAALAVLVVSCTGRLSQSGGPGEGTGMGSPTTDPLDTPGSSCQTNDLLPARLWRLTAAEYRASLRDVLELAAEPEVELEPEPVVAGFKNNASALSVSSRIAEQFQKAAAKLAPEGLLTFARHAGCDAAATTDETCVGRFITSFGARAFRRPLSAEEVTGYLAVYRAGLQDQDGDHGVELVIQTLLQSPHFLYRSELGDSAAEAATGMTELSGYELASALSYSLWGAPPDVSLLDAAGSGALGNPEGLTAQAERLLRDPKAESRITSFVSQWLMLADPAALRRDPVRFPDFEGNKPDLVQEIAWLSKQAFLAPGATLGSVFASPASLVTGGLRDLYGISANEGSAAQEAPLAGTGRLGLLTSGWLIASWSRDVDTAPMNRGKNLLGRVLCQALPPPPPELEIPPIIQREDATTRERFEAHSQTPVCAGCHDQLDAVAFALEHFDSEGRYRSQENGKPIDASGHVEAAGDMSGSFANIGELGQRLAGSRDARVCLARQLVRFTGGIGEGSDNECLLQALVDEATSHADSPRALLTALVVSDRFRKRRVR